ncbi:MAG TPA: pilus assembly protein TadG-related protein [Candidatus Acidoferrales bacterium]
MRRNSEAGQALAVTIVVMVALIGFAGLGVDMGMLRYEKRLQQSAADAAAIAGANDVAFPSGGAIEAGQNASAANSYTDTSGNDVSKCGPGAAVGTVCVQIDNPPLDGPHDGVTGCSPAVSCYVEARVAAVQPTYFMRILGVMQETVTARAVATNVSGGPNNGCVYALGSGSPPAGGIQGSGATLNNPNCTIIDNGDFLGGLVTNLALFGASGSGGNGTPATSDPLSYLTAPVGTIYPPTTLNSGTTNFAPGVYVISGGNLTIGGNATVTGTGVTFYFTNGATISVSGSASLQLTAPTTGPYAGILFFQDPNDTNPPLLGGVGNVLSGILYFPKAPLTLSGGSSVGAIVTQSLTLTGGQINLQGFAGLSLGANGVKVATLVE